MNIGPVTRAPQDFSKAVLEERAPQMERDLFLADPLDLQTPTVARFFFVDRLHATQQTTLATMQAEAQEAAARHGRIGNMLRYGGIAAMLGTLFGSAATLTGLPLLGGALGALGVGIIGYQFTHRQLSQALSARVFAAQLDRAEPALTRILNQEEQARSQQQKTQVQALADPAPVRPIARGTHQVVIGDVTIEVADPT